MKPRTEVSIRPFRSLGRAALVIVLAVPISPAGAAAQSPAGEDVITEALEDLHLLINRHRSAVGCPELRWHEGAARVAEAHSRDMAEREYFDHLTPEGVDLARRLLVGGVGWRGTIAENLAYTPAGAESALELWLDSPPHRANLEECAFTHHGIGLYRYRWTEVLLEDPTGGGGRGRTLP